MSRELARQAASMNLTSRPRETIPVGRKSNPRKLRQMLNAVSTMPVVTHVCNMTGISRSSIRYWLKKSEKGRPGDGFDLEWRGNVARFHEHWADAMEEGVERVEIATITRALGYLEPQTYQGRVIYREDPDLVRLGFSGVDAYLLDENGHPVPESIERQSEDLQMFILKARKPEVYRDHSKMDVNVGGGVLVLAAKAKTSEELEQRANEITANPIDVEFREVPENE